MCSAIAPPLLSIDPQRVLAELRGELIARGIALQANGTDEQRRQWLALLAGYESLAGEWGGECASS